MVFYLLQREWIFPSSLFVLYRYSTRWRALRSFVSEYSWWTRWNRSMRSDDFWLASSKYSVAASQVCLSSDRLIGRLKSCRIRLYALLSGSGCEWVRVWSVLSNVSYKRRNRTSASLEAHWMFFLMLSMLVREKERKNMEVERERKKNKEKKGAKRTRERFAEDLVWDKLPLLSADFCPPSAWLSFYLPLKH